MKKLSILCSMMVVIGIAVEAEAFSFSFDSGDGTGTAQMEITIAGTALTLTLENTTQIDYGAPGITGFGLNLDPDTAFSSWSLTAYDSDGNLQTIGGSSVVDGDWVITDNSIAGVSFDYLPTTSGENIKGALYNPDAVGSSMLAALPNYFTLATLVMEFNDTPNLDFPSSPFVRMQNVGLDGEGSLKLYGDPSNPIPEPATMLLFGTGLIGLAGIARRKRS